MKIERIANKYLHLDVGRDRHARHIVLSGSGMKLFVFLLALYVLHLLGYRFLSVTGTSGGAIVGAALAKYYDPDAPRAEREQAMRAMLCTALKFDVPRLLDPQWMIWRMAFGLGGAIRGDRILKALRRELPATFEGLCMPFAATAFQVNLRDPRTRVLTDGDLPSAVRASMSIPYVFSPVRRGTMLLVDGGWQMNLALPNGGENVLALTFGTGTSQMVEDVPHNLALASKLVDGAMDEAMRRAVESAPDAEIISLKTDLGAMDFFMSEADKIRGMQQGASSVLKWERRKKG